ncbi:transglutaminase domain-containing protein [Kitasatospora sp. NPDC058115]|uniref:transglutaminase domain-containing protein n=1 Tax=Kitasatospora sp. NPDC058115 TaxID=3346347 RepID=UPI0036D9C5E1
MTPATGPLTAAAPEAAGWVSALRQIVPTPDAYARFDMDREAALTVMRCPGEVLDLLVREGLRSRGDGDRARFEDSDIRNVAAASGSGGSFMELVQRYLFRFAASPPGEWVNPRSWAMRNLAACVESDDCGGAWEFARLASAEFGGEARDERTAKGTELEVRGASVEGRPPAAGFAATVRTVGSVRRVRDPLVREAFHASLEEMRSGRMRYQDMPVAMRNDPAAARANGTANCISVSLHLRDVLTAAGLRARTRKGYLMGLLGSDHSWAEVHEDGEWKVIDPVFALLGLRQGAGEEFVEFCLGSVPNRLVPCDCPADRETVRHTHDGTPVAVRNVLLVNPLKEKA